MADLATAVAAAYRRTVVHRSSAEGILGSSLEGTGAYQHKDPDPVLDAYQHRKGAYPACPGAEA